MKHFLSIAALLVMILCIGPSFAASNLSVIGSIASLRAISAAAALQIGNIEVSSYYGTGFGCPISYRWNASDSTADNGGAVINPTGNGGAGRWDINQPPGSPVHTCTFGVKVDGTTDNSTQLQAALTWAHTYGPNWVHIDGGPWGQCAKFGTTLVPAEGELITGSGEGNNNATEGNTCLSFTNTTGYAFALQTTLTGLGTTPFESPKFRDMAIYLPTSTNPGGCIQLNSIGGGFTDGTDSQQPLIHPEIVDVYCGLGFVAANQQIGFQISKGSEIKISHSDVYLGATGMDMEGTENAYVGDSCRVTNTYGSMMKFVKHGSFGNNGVVDHCQFLVIANLAQAADSFVYSTNRSIAITNNFFEGDPPSGGSVGSAIHIAGGFNAYVANNQMDMNSSIAWLKVDGTMNNLTAINNGANGASISTPQFVSSQYFYNGSGLIQTLAHYGNGENGDTNWPYNSQSEASVVLPNNTLAIFTPSFPGLSYEGYASLESPVNNEWRWPNVTGSSNYLLWRTISNPGRGGVVGTFDIRVLAYQTNAGSGQITCQITDNDTPVGSTIAQNVTGKLVNYTLVTNQATTTEAGVKCWNSGSNGLALVEADLVKH